MTTKRAGRTITGVTAALNFLRRTAYPTLCQGLAVVGRPLLLSRAEDVTAQTATRSCVVLAPHPDDETLGCGATIMRKLAVGTPVTVVVATDGRHSHPSNKLSMEALIEMREQEACRACAILGLAPENIVFLRFEDGRLEEHRGLLHRQLTDIVERVDPEEIFVSSMIDAHPDHRVLGELGRQLVQMRRNRFPVLYEYPIWFWNPRVWRTESLLDLRIRVVRSEDFLMRKRGAIDAYRSQVANLPDETGGAALRHSFVRQFLQPEEIFFEVVTWHDK